VEKGSGNLLVCVDDLYTPATGSCDTLKKDVGPTFASFTALPPANDYGQLCDESFQIDPQCQGGANELRLAVDRKGTAFVPMGWTQILQSKGDGTWKHRKVLGSTAYPAEKGTATPLHIPDSSFLRTTTSVGSPFPNRVVFEPIFPPERSQELTLSGETDKPHSVLVIERRKPWAYTCQEGKDAGEACHDGEPGECPASSCEAGSPKLFFCNGGKFAGPPCTSSKQCLGGATCTAGSTCRSFPSGGSGDACASDGDCPGDEECGPGLFEFRDRLVGGVGPVVIQRSPSDAKQGVCKGGGNADKRCTAGCGGAACIGFRVEASHHVSN
jgi:hypothetical protein